MPLKVRGTCARCGQVVDTEAAAGRATWKGPCPKAECKGIVTARRVRADPAEPPAAEPAKTTPTTTRTKRKVPRVGYATTAGRGKPASGGAAPQLQRAPEPTPGPAPTDGPERPPQPPGAGRDEPRPKKPVRAEHPESGPQRAPYDFLGW